MALQAPRNIDTMPSLSNPRPVEMQVLCLGLSRTATMSLYKALGKLGYKSYHFSEIFSEEAKKNGHIYAWNKAMREKLDGEGKPFSREEFDKILGNYSAVTDAPSACFVDELIQAYPNAKVVLGVRDPDRWLASMETSYYRILLWKPWRLLCYFNKFLAAETSLFELILRQWTDGDVYNRSKLREGFLKHNEHVRSVVPRGKLLEFRAEQGWEPLCKFLGQEIPKEPYPKVNEGDNAANLHVTIFWIVTARYVAKALVIPAVVGVLAWGLLWAERSGRLTLPWNAPPPDIRIQR